MNKRPSKRRSHREFVSRAVAAVIALIAVACSPIALVRSAGASYSGAYTGPKFCSKYGGAVGPQIVIGGMKTNIYECGGDPKDPSADANPYTIGDTPFDANGGGGDPGGSFQCVELSLRFEDVVYKENTLWNKPGEGSLLVPPTGANVVHYLYKVFHVPVAFNAGTIRIPPTNAQAPVAGNILSLGPTSSSEPSGHTAVIEKVTGSPRNYTVTIISENAPTITTINVVNGVWPTLWGLYYEYNWTRQSIGAPVLSITTPSTSTSPPNATVGVPYSFAFSASGAPGPYNWTISSGALPPGLNFSLMGRITGTPTSVSKLGPFTVQVVDFITVKGHDLRLSDQETYTLWALPAKKPIPPVTSSTCWGTCGGPEGPVGGYFSVTGGKVQDFQDTQACLGATGDGFTYYLEIDKPLPITADTFSYNGPASIWNGMAKTGTDVMVTLTGKFTTSSSASITLHVVFGQCGTTHLTIKAVPG